MWRVIQFLRKFGNFLLFLFLELIALLLIINLNHPHKDISQGFLLEISGNLNNIGSTVSGYFYLNSENEKLKAENLALRTRLNQLHSQIHQLEQQNLDSNYKCWFPSDTNQYHYLSCRAVNNSIDNNYNYITLNKGLKDGVERGMGVFSPQGIVGRVIDVSTNYALAISLLNPKLNVSAKLLRNSDLGIFTWNGASPSYGNLLHIPQTITIKQGDTIVTSNYGTTFPEGFFIGKVEKFHKKNQDGFYDITVKLSADFHNLDHLYLVKHLQKSEIDSLQIKAQ